MTQHATRTKEASPGAGRTNQTERSRGTGAAANRRLGPASLAAAGNQTVQRLFAEGAIRPKLRVGSPDDPAEHEADQMAEAAMQGGTSCTCSPGAPACPRCQAAQGMVRRKPRNRDKPAGADNLSLGVARPLGGGERSFFESRYNADLSDVRVHDNEETASSAAQLNARAFSLGSHIAFGRGEYRPHSSEGRLLLAHELDHVVQQTPAGSPAVIRRDEASMTSEQPPAGGEVCTAEPDAPQVCEDTSAVASVDPNQPASLNLTGTYEQRIAAFKQLVKTTAIHRLIGNQRNLSMWAVLINKVIPAVDLASIGMTQSGGLRALNEMQDIRDPMVRELRANQAVGRYRACTGCHIENQAWGTRDQRSAMGGQEWLSPNEQRAGMVAPSPFSGMAPLSAALFEDDRELLAAWIGSGVPGAGTAAAGTTATASGTVEPSAPGYDPPAGTLEGRLNQLFPDPTKVQEAMDRVRPILLALGPEGYKVLPDSILVELEGGSIEALRNTIDTAISERKEGYSELIKKIQAGEVGYEHFGPIIRDLLPAADEEVRTAIQEEMDDKAFWDKVEAIVVGVLSVAALILTIFPPTSAAGLALFGALELGLATYGAISGPEMMRMGEIYGLGTGAHNVFMPEQQAAAGSMILGGFLSVVLAPLGAYSGAARLETAATRIGQAGAQTTTALATVGRSAPGMLGRAGQTIERGGFVVTVAEDGSMIATVANRPDLLIIVRGETATLYQSMGPGGMRVMGTMSVPRAAGVPQMLPGPAGEAAMVPAGSSAMVPYGGGPFTAAPVGVPAPGGPWLVPSAPRTPLLLPEAATAGPRAPPWSLGQLEPSPFVLPSRAPAPGQSPAYLLPVGPQGQGGVILTNRGLQPADFGMSTIAQDPRMLALWNDALDAAANTGRSNAYTRWVDAVADGSVSTWSSRQLGEAFDVVNSRYLEAARAQGIDVATVHHWNFPKSQYPRSIVDPHHLVPVEGQASMSGGYHPVHQGGLHPLTTGNPSRPTAGPVAPVHVLPLNTDFPGMPPGWHPPMVPPAP